MVWACALCLLVLQAAILTQYFYHTALSTDDFVLSRNVKLNASGLVHYGDLKLKIECENYK
jgi:hypothetical protein